MKYIQPNPNPTDFRKLFNSTEQQNTEQEQHDGDVKLVKTTELQPLKTRPLAIGLQHTGYRGYYNTTL